MNVEFLNNLDNYIKIKRYRLVKSILVYENGALVFERYYNGGGADKPSALMSVWKSLLSLVTGICLDKKIIGSLDEPITAYLPQFDKNIHMYHKFITVRHLLTMSSGIYFIPGVHYHVPMMEQMLRSGDWVSYIADVRVTEYPGTKFTYKEWDVIILSSLIGIACGGSAWEVADEFLFKPLGIVTDRWLISKYGVNYNVDFENHKYDAMTARDLAKIGLLMLNNGEWDGEQIISSEYIKKSVEPSVANPGYGFLWWLSDKGYHGKGFGGQELNIYPDKNIVAVIQASVTSSGKNYPDICEGIFS